MTDSNTDIEILQRLYTVVESRKDSDAESSYTASLLRAGIPKIAQKLGEEAVETVIAATTGDDKEIIGESADLLYHLLVIWVAKGITLDDVWAELSRREGTSGIAEKASRKS
jgi:phosphoribosyl-ATP pyrophosphohydrolase